MTKQYDLIVFDWEGTIAEDPLGHVISILAREARRFDLGPVDKSLARRYITLGLSSTIKKLFPELTLYQFDHFFETVQAAMSHASTEINVVDEALSTIQKIHHANLKLAIATNKGHQSLQRALQVSGLDRYFKVTRSASQVPAKPCPQMLAEIMDESAAIPSQTLMIGDSITDIEMAVALNVDAIGMDFYHLQQEEFLNVGAIRVFDCYQQVAEYLNLKGGEA